MKKDIFKRNNCQKAIFIDRDGVLIEDPGWLSLKEQIKVLPGVFKAIQSFKKAGYLIIVISNQSAVARGIITLKQLQEIDQIFREKFSQKKADIDDVYYCPHHPDFTGPCSCRKPKPGMFLKAIKKWQIDPQKSVVIGDMLTDLEAGKNAGCALGILVKRNQEAWVKDEGASSIIDKRLTTICQAAKYLLKK